jgi:hypothetical protein
MIIEAKGFFCGDRLSSCSDEAQLFWPRYFLASNSVGRIELNYDELQATAFKSLRKKPTREEFEAHIHEYSNNYLLFVYQVDGVVWGQWDTDKRNLPRYSTRDANRSPAPPAEDFLKWRDKYTDIKAVRNSQGFAAILRESQRITVNRSDSHETAHGVGVGIGIGIGKTNPSTESFSKSDKPFNAIESARFVCLELNLAGQDMMHLLEQVIQNDKNKLGVSETDTAEAMVASWRAYMQSEAGRDKQFRKSPKTFFGQGAWKDWNKQPEPRKYVSPAAILKAQMEAD